MRPGKMSLILHFYPRPPRGGRHKRGEDGRVVLDISIHALREEGDHHLRHPVQQNQISIHALREEGDLIDISDLVGIFRFLSTPSARRATVALRSKLPSASISIHALREEGDNLGHAAAHIVGSISIHALREEGDAHLDS